MAKQKVSKVVITWAGPDWRPRIEASLRRPEFAHLAVVFCQDRADVLREIRDAEVVFATTFDAGLLQAAERLQWIHLMKGGVDNTLFTELIVSPVMVTCLKDLFTAPGAEFALMAMLLVQRRMTWSVGRPKLAQSSSPLDLSLKPQDLDGRTVAILGLGNIGHRVAELSRAFGVRVLGMARRAPADAALLDAFYPPEKAGEMLAQADFVVVALPFTPETKGCFGAQTLGTIKLGGWLIDVSGRPALIDYAALRAALDSGRLGGVFLQPCGTQCPEVPGPNDDFWLRENVVVSPCRCVSTEQQENSVGFFSENLRRFESGQPLRGLVDKAAGY